MNRIRLFSLALIALLLVTATLAACTTEEVLSPLEPGQNPAEIDADLPEGAAPLWPSTPTPPFSQRSPTPDPFMTIPVDGNINPLTGLEVDDIRMLERRPIMVKVSNWSDVPRAERPQAGLSSADMVFEYYVGYGLNRFLAIFYSQDAPQVGPVRSGRLVDRQLGEMYQGILIYGNADDSINGEIYNVLGTRALAVRDLPCPLACGQDTHDTAGILVDTREVYEYGLRHEINNSRHDLRGMVFDAAPPAGDRMALEVGVQFSPVYVRSEWRYNPDLGLYQRWEEKANGKDGVFEMIPSTDRNNGEQLAFANVIILFPHYITYAPSKHDIRIWDNTEGQPAVFYRDGMMLDGFWRVPDPGRPIQFSDRDGNPLPLKPGKTWIVLASPQSIFDEVRPAVWNLKFDIPWPTPTPSPSVTPEP